MCVNRYWNLKKEMAPGSEPPHIQEILRFLQPWSAAVSLCGAGAGGFAVLVLRTGVDVAMLEREISAWNSQSSESAPPLSMHMIRVDCEGIVRIERTHILDTVSHYLSSCFI
jgi:hypothetical protein